MKLVSERTNQIAETPFIYSLTDFKDYRVASLGNYSIYYKISETDIIISAFWGSLQIDISISELLNFNNRTFKEKDRLDYFISLNKTEFTRKDYMNVFKDISSATASRDLKKGVELNLFEKIGEKNRTIYRLK